MVISQPSRGLRHSLANRLNRLASPIQSPLIFNQKTYAATNIEEYNLRIDADAGDWFTFIVETVSSAPKEGSALFEIRALTDNGTRIAIPQWGYQSNRIQEFQYIEPSEPDEIAMTIFSVPVPAGATQLELVGRRWKKDIATAVVGEPLVNKHGEGWVFETDTGARLEFPAYRYNEICELENVEKIQLTINHVARGSKSAGPLVIKFIDSNNEELMPTGELAQHSEHGPIAVLKGDEDALTTTLVQLSVPADARFVSIRGLDWSSKTANIVGNIGISSLANDDISIRDFIASIPREESLFVVDTTAPPMGHQTLGLRPNNLSLAAAEKGKWIVFLPFSSLQEYPAHAHEQIYQVPRSDMDLLWNAIRDYRKGTKDTYICSSFPSFESITTAYDLRRLGWKVVYEVRDDMEEFHRVGYSKWYRPILEQKMLSMADTVVSVSRALDEKMVAMYPRLASHTVIPNGVRQSVIDEGKPLRSLAAVASRSQSRTVGYVGHLTDSWFDWPLLIAAASELPSVTFEIVGHGKPIDIDLPTNVSFLGPKSHDELADIVPGWRTGLIPFKDIPLTHSVDPNKIYEYFAWGLRCVTVQMGSVDSYPWTKVYDDLDSFIEHILWSVETPVTDEDLSELEEFVKTMSWDARVGDMLDFIGDATDNE